MRLLSEMSLDELRKAAANIRDDIFAYEMSGDTYRIPQANERESAIYREMKSRERRPNQ